MSFNKTRASAMIRVLVIIRERRRGISFQRSALEAELFNLEVREADLMRQAENIIAVPLEPYEL